MPAGCCHGASCSCVIVAEGRLNVEGSGQPNDPFLMDIEAEFEPVSNVSFDTLVTGDGTVADPWLVETQYADTSKLDHIPDVNAPTPTNGQVLSWNSTTQRWVPAAPTVAPTGAVQHDDSLSGDGSVGTPLLVVPNAARLLGSSASGVGLSDAGMVSVVQHFVDSAARAAAIPTPVVNQLTMLDSNPGIVDYWTGAAWEVQENQNSWAVIGGEFMELSGPYSAGLRLTVLVAQVATTTDASGIFDVLTAADLAGMSGVLSVSFQETGTVGWKAVVYPSSGEVLGKAYWMTDGSVVAGSPITGTVLAVLY